MIQYQNTLPVCKMQVGQGGMDAGHTTGLYTLWVFLFCVNENMHIDTGRRQFGHMLAYN
jgi:hypothetical protein